VKKDRVRTKVVDCWLACGIFRWANTPVTVQVSKVIRVPRGVVFVGDDRELTALERSIAGVYAERIPKPQPRMQQQGIINVKAAADIFPQFVLTSLTLMGSAEVEYVPAEEQQEQGEAANMPTTVTIDTSNDKLPSEEPDADEGDDEGEPSH
jgi:hypothetical protein